MNDIENSPADIGDYIENGYTGHQVFMPTKAYSQALDAIVVGCVDILITYDNKILIGKRTRAPQADWWVFGGRMRTGERIDESASRLVRDELRIVIDPSRFNYLTTFAAAWNARAHTPEANGTHTLSVVFLLDLNEIEFRSIQINDEYSEIRMIESNSLVADDRYHDALRQCVRAYNDKHMTTSSQKLSV